MKIIRAGTADGGGGSIPVLEILVGEDIAKFKVITVHSDNKAYKVDLNTASVIGVTIKACLSNEITQYKNAGEISDTGFSFTAGEYVYSDNSGNITQTVPISGNLICIGIATGTNKFNLNLEPIIA